MNLKNKRGITLIALVITIIVLLILAGVTIATLMGDNGVLTKANKASEENTHSTVYEGLSLEITNYYADKKLGKTTESLINYLKSNSIIDEDLVINVEELVGQTLSLGNGNTTDGDYYKLEEVIATVSTTKELEKVATTGEVKVADTSDDDSTQYKLVYCRTVNVVEWEKEIVNVEPDHPSLGKLADVVEVGDYINYKTGVYVNDYGNIVSGENQGEEVKWQVCYVNRETEEVRITTEMDVEIGAENRLLDTDVATAIRNMLVEDIDYLENIGVINVTSKTDTGEIFETTAQSNFLFTSGSSGGISYLGPGILELTFGETINKPVVTLKNGITYTSGEGTWDLPYEIY